VLSSFPGLLSIYNQFNTLLNDRIKMSKMIGKTDLVKGLLYEMMHEKYNQMITTTSRNEKNIRNAMDSFNENDSCFQDILEFSAIAMAAYKRMKHEIQWLCSPKNYTLICAQLV